MPVVRRYGARQVLTAALPGARRSAAETELSAGVGLERAKAQRSDALAAVGAVGAQLSLREAARLRQEEIDRADQVAIMEADTGLGRWVNKRMFDPETGALSVKGKDANALPEQVGAEFNQVAGEIEQTLTTPRQQLAFRRTRAQQAENLDGQLRRHVFQEQQAYDANVVKATVDTAVESAIANAQDPRRVGIELQKATDAITGSAKVQGWSPEVVQKKVADLRSATHEGVIYNLLATPGQEHAAKEYYEEVEAAGQLSGVAETRVKKALETATTNAQGLATAEEIWTQFAPAPTDHETPIPIAEMEAAARARAGSDAAAYDMTRKYLRERAASVEGARKDRTEQDTSTLYKAVADGASLAEVQKTPEYRRASGQVQTTVSEHIVRKRQEAADRVWTLGQREAADMSRTEAKKEQAGWSMFWNYNQPEILSQMTEPQILALAPDLGQDHTNRLIESRRKLAASAAVVRTATIDRDLFLALADADGLPAYKPQKSQDERAMLGQLQSRVEATIDAEQTQKQRLLSREEKAAVMTKVLDAHVMISTWGRDPSRSAATVVHGDSEAAYVPLETIPDHALNQWINIIRSESPSAQHMSRAEILSQWRTRIEKAHAAAELRLGVDEERRRLLGR